MERGTPTLTTRTTHLALAVLSVAALAGCASNVRLDPPTIPEPLINTLPMTVAVRLPENFEHFIHEEEVLGREEWRIDLGRSNAIFFTQLFNYMFETVKVLEPGQDPTGMDIDALLEPSIDAFEFSVPAQTKTDSFAVWIRYRIKVYDREGTLVLDAPVSAYGKALTTTLGGSKALQNAAVLAMRDAAALMIMKFDEQTLFSRLADPSVHVPGIASGGNDNEAAVTRTVSGGKND